MKLYDFLILSEDEQFNAVWNSGVFVGQIFENDIVINLYAINEFFVEVYYNSNLNKIVDKKSFKYGHLLEKYLDQIKF
jgi:hypothetical protein